MLPFVGAMLPFVSYVVLHHRNVVLNIRKTPIRYIPWVFAIIEDDIIILIIFITYYVVRSHLLRNALMTACTHCSSLVI